MADGSDGDGQRDALQQREVDVNVEALCLETSEAVHGNSYLQAKSRTAL